MNKGYVVTTIVDNNVIYITDDMKPTVNIQEASGFTSQAAAKAFGVKLSDQFAKIQVRHANMKPVPFQLGDILSNIGFIAVFEDVKALETEGKEEPNGVETPDEVTDPPEATPTETPKDENQENNDLSDFGED